jgi:serine/threonine-protein kinase
MSVFGAEQVGRVLGARYRLDAPVGAGASATVFRAEDLQLRRTVAVKVLHPSLADDPAFLKRFRAEAQAAAALNHPNVMAVYDWGEEDGRPFLVGEYLSGGSLRHMLDRGRRLTPSQALVVGLEAARGLDHAHSRGLVHRDIKPANLLFSEDGRLRIADFGIARALADAAWTDPSGVVLSTARYASPEQARGKPVDGKSDIYSLALTLIESVTGTVPFAADTTVSTLMARLDKLMPVSAELGPLASVLERAGRPDPDDRFDAAGLAKALVASAERLSRPAPLPLVLTDSELFGSDDADSRTADGPTTIGPVGARSGDTEIGPVVPAAYDATKVVGPAERMGVDAPLPPVTAASSATPPVLPTDDQSAPTTAIYDAAADLDRPRRWVRRVLIALVALLVAGAVALAAFFYIDANRPTAEVASVVTLEEAQARNVLETAGFEVTVNRIRRDGTEQGTVLEQNPVAGVELREGRTVTIVVSDGPELKPLPELVNLPQIEADARLRVLNLAVGTITTENSEDVQRDYVIRWSVPGQGVLPVGTEVVSGTTVDLVVSAGPAQRPVPDITNVAYDQAVAMLADPTVRLNAQRVDDEFSRDIPIGNVIRTDPPVGTDVDRDSTVTIVVSKGPDYVTVPNVIGMSLTQARDTLIAAGLGVGDVSGQGGDIVASQSLGANAQAVRGDAVDLVVGPPAPPPSG